MGYVMKHLFLMFVCAAMAFLAGCVPGEAEFSIKTSALNKAMRGEYAEITVCVKGNIVLSNATDKMSVEAKGIKTIRDFALVLANLYSEMFTRPEFADKTRDLGRNMSFTVEDRENDWPLLNMAATFPASVTRKGAEPDDKNNKKCMECMEKSGTPITCFAMDPETGLLEESESKTGYNVAFVEYASKIMGAGKMLKALNIIDNGPANQLYENIAELGMRPFCATCLEHLYFLVEGDDDKPVLIVGKDVKVDGKPVADYRAWIRNGDKVHIELNASQSNKAMSRLKDVHFFETEVQAEALGSAK